MESWQIAGVAFFGTADPRGSGPFAGSGGPPASGSCSVPSPVWLCWPFRCSLISRLLSITGFGHRWCCSSPIGRAGQLFVKPSTSQERALRWPDYRLDIRAISHRTPQLVAEVLEAAYAGVAADSARPADLPAILDVT